MKRLLYILPAFIFLNIAGRYVWYWYNFKYEKLAMRRYL